MIHNKLSSTFGLLPQYITMLFLYYLVAAASIATASPTVYLIRHGEKPSDGGTGLSAQGVQRSQCVRSVFGKDSGYNIGYILAQTPKKSMSQALLLRMTIVQC
jgi:hypothetical protein